MLPKYHVILSFLASLILYQFNMNYIFLILFFLSSILIDFDHYLFYVIRKKNLSLVKAYHYCRYELEDKLKKSGKKQELLIIFHTIESFAFLFILSLVYGLFWAVFFGSVFHMVLDIIHGSFKKSKKYKRAFSLIYHVLKYKKLA